MCPLPASDALLLRRLSCVLAVMASAQVIICWASLSSIGWLTPKLHAGQNVVVLDRIFSWNFYVYYLLTSGIVTLGAHLGMWSLVRSKDKMGDRRYWLLVRDGVVFSAAVAAASPAFVILAPAAYLAYRRLRLGAACAASCHNTRAGK